jgi:Cu2+-exporting ATPase
MRPDLTGVKKSLVLSKAVVGKIQQNLFWAFFYNIVGIPIALGLLYPFTGYLLNPVIAGAAMAFSSVSVVSNTLMLKRKRF